MLIILFGYNNILKIILLNIDKLILNKRIFFITFGFIFLLILLFNNNLKNYSDFLNDISDKKINNFTDQESINPEFNKSIVNFFKNLEIKDQDKILTNYYALEFLKIPSLSKIQDKLEWSSFENSETLEKANYIIVFKTCEQFLLKFYNKKKFKIIRNKNNSCIFYEL